MYPRSQRVITMPDPNGVGDSMKAELALNRFMESSKIHHRIMTALRQALLYPGSGATFHTNLTELSFNEAATQAELGSSSFTEL